MSFPNPINESNRLKSLLKSKILDTFPERDFDELTQLAAFICETPIAFISFVDEERQWFKSSIGIDIKETRRDIAICAHTVYQNSPLIIQDLSKDVRFSDNPLVLEDPKLNFYGGFPVTLEGHALGSLCVADLIPRKLSQEQIDSLESIARQISLLLKLRQQTFELEEKNEILEKSEKQNEFIIESVPPLVWTISKDGTVDYVNKRVFDYFGVDEKSTPLSDIDWNSLMHPDDREQSNESWKKCLETGEPYEMEFRLRGANGKYRWYLGHAVPMLDDNGKIIKWLGTNTDITDLKTAEKAVFRSNQYQDLFRHANDGIIIFDPKDEIIIDVNDYACGMYGYTRKELIGRSLKELSKNIDHGANHLEILLKNGKSESFETIHFHKNGKELNFLINASIIKFNGKQAILSINRDITGYVLANKALFESELKFRTLIESMSDGLLQTDLEDRILFANSRFCQMTGYQRQELIGKNTSILLTDENESAVIKKAAERHLKGISDTYEIQLKTKSGDLIWVLIGAVSLMENDGTISSSMGVFTDITERKSVEKQLIFNALHDSLTRLPNRKLLNEHLKQTIERNKRIESPAFAVLFIDLDRFKVVNDTLGHLDGDKLLIMAARRLEESIRPGDIVARVGGDEFSILLENTENLNIVTHIVKRIQENLRKPFNLRNREIFIDLSIGIALNNPKYSIPEQILRDADTAMLQAKADGKGCFRIFNQEMQRQANYLLQLESEMRRALIKGDFCLDYQPIIELSNLRIVGFESLIRWNHPKHGIIPPLDFIPIAEENGLIIPIGEWVLQESCKQLHRWQTRYPQHKDLTMSVNLSSKQFIQTNLVEHITEILRKTKTHPQFLRLEITESHVMKNDEASIRAMNSLCDIGVEFSIDDFGTGYSNLSYLKNLPINYLKIDRSFVNQMQDNKENRELIRTIITLAKNLGFKVIAEGIELEEQSSQLQALNCSFGQGFFFSRPIDERKVNELLSKSTFIEPANDFDITTNTNMLH